MKYTFFLFIFLFSVNLQADEKVIGHISPFFEELLIQPIDLECGAVIREWQGQYSQDDIKKLNNLCTYAKNSFWEFVEENSLNVEKNKPFHYNLSLLIDGHGYRQLNDLQWRFSFRSNEVWGYTSKDLRYSFILSDLDNRNFNKTFIHELFHALSIHYGLYKNPSSDEKLARKFEEKYGTLLF